MSIWESSAPLIEEMSRSRLAAASASSGVDLSLISPASSSSEITPFRNIKKTDLIRLSINLITEHKRSFTFYDVYIFMQECIDKQTVSALVNRLYATGELISDERTVDGCLNYIPKSIRSIPSWIDAMDIDEAVRAFKNCTEERERADREDPSIQTELTCGESFIAFMNRGFHSFLSGHHGASFGEVRRYVTEMD